LQLARGFLTFGAGLALLAALHAHAALLAFASRHKTPVFVVYFGVGKFLTFYYDRNTIITDD